MEITSTERLVSGIFERRFTVAGAGGRAVPGVLWTPSNASARTPLVLVGHGGGGSKERPNVLALRDYFTGAHHVATAAIDAPAHGERGSGSAEARADLWRTPGVVDDMNADWARTLDALLALAEFDARAVGYFGLSMGTMFGLPYVASEPRIAAAVLGLCGVSPGASTFGGGAEFFATSIGRVAADAARLSCPIFYHVQWDDELFDRDGAFDLYGMIGSPDKRLQSTPGPHGPSTPEGTETMRSFLANRLRVVPATA